MPSFNQITLMGHLTREPLTKAVGSTTVTEFGIACNRKWRDAQGQDREEVLFMDCACWGKRGEVIAQYFTKGKPIFVQGHVRYDVWDDKNGGGKRSKHSVTVDDFQFIGDRQGGGNGERAQGQRVPTKVPAPGAERRFVVPEPEEDTQRFQEQDIPF